MADSEHVSTPEGDVVEDEGGTKLTPALVPYLCFGFGAEDDARPMLDERGALEYLGRQGLDRGPLTQVRKDVDPVALAAEPSDGRVHRCDFCGKPLVDVEYERLRDGRERCMECGATVVRGARANRALVEDVRRTMCQRFSIDLNARFDVRVVSARRLAKRFGRDFTPTDDMDPRAVGVSVASTNRRDGSRTYEVYLENGCPRFSLTTTMAHEFTHIWQYTHWDQDAIKARYGKLKLLMDEGMAQWVSVQYAFFLGDRRRAMDYLKGEASRSDEYGVGLRLFATVYPFNPGPDAPPDTPFQHPDEPIPLELVAAMVAASQEGDGAATKG